MTAEIIGKRNNLKVQESSAGGDSTWVNGKEHTRALHLETPGLVAQIFNDPASFEYPDGESFAVFTARVQAALEKLLVTHKSGDVALVVSWRCVPGALGRRVRRAMYNWLRWPRRTPV